MDKQRLLVICMLVPLSFMYGMQSAQTQQIFQSERLIAAGVPLDQVLWNRSSNQLLLVPNKFLRGEMHSIRVLDVNAQQWIKELQKHKFGIIGVSQSSDSRYIASCSWDGSIQVYDQFLSQLIYDRSSSLIPMAITWSPDNKHFAVACDHFIIVSNIQSPDDVYVLEDGADGTYMLSSISWSPSGDYIAGCFVPTAGSSVPSQHNDYMCVWNVTTKQISFRINKTGVTVSWCPFTECNYIAVESYSLITIHDGRTGAVIHRLEGHTDIVRSFAWGRNGRSLFLVSGSNDKSIRFWNLSTGALIQTIITDDMVSSVALSPDGMRLAFCTSSDNLRLWRRI